MRKLVSSNAWVAAILSWLLATVLVSGTYVLWLTIRHQPIQWSFVRDAALMAAPIALFRAWRDSGRRE